MYIDIIRAIFNKISNNFTQLLYKQYVNERIHNSFKIVNAVIYEI